MNTVTPHAVSRAMLINRRVADGLADIRSAFFSASADSMAISEEPHDEVTRHARPTSRPRLQCRCARARVIGQGLRPPVDASSPSRLPRGVILRHAQEASAIPIFRHHAEARRFTKMTRRPRRSADILSPFHDALRLCRYATQRFRRRARVSSAIAAIPRQEAEATPMLFFAHASTAQIPAQPGRPTHRLRRDGQRGISLTTN